MNHLNSPTDGNPYFADMQKEEVPQQDYLTVRVYFHSENEELYGRVFPEAWRLK